MSNDILGYSQTDSGWKPIVQPRGYIYTCAFILCRECNAAISSHGGPRYNSICLSCYDKMQKTT